jgi:hypothetical protein
MDTITKVAIAQLPATIAPLHKSANFPSAIHVELTG